MEGGSELRRWDELIPDALGMIFCNLSLQELLTVITSVCKSWAKVIAGPYCWQEINIDEWSRYVYRPLEPILPLVRMLIMRSEGSLRKLCVSSLSSILTDEDFSFIADHAGSLQELRISRSWISNSIVEKCAQKFTTITFLDVSFCLNIEASALEAIGKHCKSLLVLRRLMDPTNVHEKICQDNEAHAIATTMPTLKQLELAYALVSTEAVLKILLNCRKLEYLDLRGCWNVKLDQDFLKDNFSGLKVLIVKNPYEMDLLFGECTGIPVVTVNGNWEVLANELDGMNYEDIPVVSMPWEVLAHEVDGVNYEDIPVISMPWEVLAHEFDGVEL